jgi:dTDP-4-amino-4,6-dideoxygalactose transaminase
MHIPMVDLRRHSADLEQELNDAFKRVAASGRYILGEEVAEFEREIAEFIGSKFAVGVASGTDALWLALRACGVGPGDRVITTAFTFIGTVSAILYLGAEPVFVDVDSRTLNIDPSRIRVFLDGSSPVHRRLDVVPETVKAVLPVHLYGGPANIDALLDIGKEFDLVVIEDAAQALGSELRSKMTGTFGSIGCFSFFPTKNLGALGDGGLVTTDNSDLADRVRKLRTHGSVAKYRHEFVGTNSRLDALQAAALRVKLARLPEWLARRRTHAAAYQTGLQTVPQIWPPTSLEGAKHSYHQYTIRIVDGQRDRLGAFLAERGVDTAIYYPLPLHLQPALQHLGYRRGDLPESEKASSEVISLPIFPELSESERAYVIESITEFFHEDKKTADSFRLGC